MLAGDIPVGNISVSVVQLLCLRSTRVLGDSFGDAAHGPGIRIGVGTKSATSVLGIGQVNGATFDQ